MVEERKLVNTMRKRLPAALCLAGVAWLLVGLTAKADGSGSNSDDNANKSYVLDDVVVSDTKIQDAGSGATTINATQIAPMRAATSDTATLLKDIPGVSFYGAGGISSLPVVHGLADDRLRVQVDGVGLIAACPNHMNSPLSYIDPTKVGTVAVLAGITPASVGGDSLGGTIIVNSAPPEFAKPGEGVLTNGNIGTFYRSNGDAFGGNLSATVATESYSLTYDGSSTQSGNYKAGDDFKAAGPAASDRGWLDGDEVGSSRYKAMNHAIAAALRQGTRLVELKVGLQDIPYEGFPNQRMDMTDNDTLQENLHYNDQFAWGTLDARAYHEKTRHKMDFADDKQFLYGSAATFFAPGMPMETEGENRGGQIKADISLSGRDNLTVGSELQQYRLDDWWPPSPAVLPPGYTMGGMAPNTFWNINDGKRDRLCLFADWEARWTSQWLTLLGARAEQVTMDAGPVQGYNNVMAGYAVAAAAFNARDRKRTDDNQDVTALARFSPDASKTFEIGFARKTRSPNLYERYSWSQNSMALIMNNFVGDGNGYLGDIDLNPEVANTLSATADWHDAGGDWGLKATPFVSYVDDFIDAVRCTGSGTGMNSLCGGAANNTATEKFVQLQYANQAAKLYGVDLSGHLLLARTEGWGVFTASGLVNHVRGTNRDTGDDLYNIMPLHAKFALSQKNGGLSNSIELQLVSKKKDVSDVRQEMETSGYGLVNLRASYAWKRVRLDFGVENLFDKFYDYPLGGAYVGQGMTMSTNGVPWGTPVPGMGRSLYAGVNYQF